MKERSVPLASTGIRLQPRLVELWVNLGDDGLREAAYRGG
jgi:hypothetical protein